MKYKNIKPKSSKKGMLMSWTNFGYVLLFWGIIVIFFIIIFFSTSTKLLTAVDDIVTYQLDRYEVSNLYRIQNDYLLLNYLEYGSDKENIADIIIDSIKTGDYSNFELETAKFFTNEKSWGISLYEEKSFKGCYLSADNRFKLFGKTVNIPDKDIALICDQIGSILFNEEDMAEIRNTFVLGAKKRIPKFLSDMLPSDTSVVVVSQTKLSYDNKNYTIYLYKQYTHYLYEEYSKNKP